VIKVIALKQQISLWQDSTGPSRMLKMPLSAKSY